MEISNTMNKFILGDCMNPEYGLPSYPDKFFDLAVVDPPYGIGAHGGFGQSANKGNFKKNKKWDNQTPSLKYFKDILRVSKNQIIWGGNYFTDKLPATRCFICWHKKQQGKCFSDFELAWTSFDKISKMISLHYLERHEHNIYNKNKRIHPTQKPVALYSWLLENYAKPGDLILDTHVGSASSLIACESLGFNYVGFEIDADYYEAAKKRMGKGVQSNLFATKNLQP